MKICSIPKLLWATSHDSSKRFSKFSENIKPRSGFYRKITVGAVEYKALILTPQCVFTEPKVVKRIHSLVQFLDGLAGLGVRIVKHLVVHTADFFFFFATFLAKRSTAVTWRCRPSRGQVYDRANMPSISVHQNERRQTRGSAEWERIFNGRESSTMRAQQQRQQRRRLAAEVTFVVFIVRWRLGRKQIEPVATGSVENERARTRPLHNK